MTRACVTVATVIFCVVVPSLAQESANYSMDRISIAAVGSTTSSATFATTVVIGEDSPEGASSYCNSGFVNSVGFWSVLGDLPVPIVLAVDKAQGNPQGVELTWSGTNNLFQVFRSISPMDVLDLANLDVETASCSSNDSQSAAIVFYKVVPKP